MGFDLVPHLGYSSRERTSGCNYILSLNIILKTFIFITCSHETKLLIGLTDSMD